MKTYLDLTKSGIVLFVLVSGLVGYAVSYPIGHPLEYLDPVILLVGLYLVSSGSFAINQAQEWRRDLQMPRTARRPVPNGVIKPWQAYAMGIVFCVTGMGLLALISQMSALLAALTVLLYNGLYTLFWKRSWAFAAVPGAIPGAMPVVIGYAVNDVNIFAPDSVYLFLIMFLWQMPHFWSLAIRYKDDYEKGGFPVLPARIGVEKTLYHIGLYTFVYAGLALSLPLFFKANILYVLLVMPLAVKIVLEFFKFFKEDGRQRWIHFFLWVNLSLLVFIGVPVVDKWLFYLVNI
ncbi:MAG: protoheme IX farnesyltransferase [Pseudobdellovibrionaceae bacterium]|nr:MAG: protoheme IX farnesyltransferase [Pseudobdellovibrionaceae bacterium]